MVYLASDHAAFKAKNEIAAFLESAGISYEDLGPQELIKDDDYPDYAFSVGEKVAAEDGAKGILLCGSGTGICIAANKVKGVRAAYLESKKHALVAREDDDANIIVLDSLTFDPATDLEIIETFLNTPFSNADRHIRRIKKITDYENE